MSNNTTQDNTNSDVAKESKISNADVDYTKLSLEDLVKLLVKLLKNTDIVAIKKEVEKIKYQFDKKFLILLTKKKQAFLQDGGQAIDFHYVHPAKKIYNELIKNYKDRRNAYYKALEKEQKNNLNRKLALVDGLKQLINQVDVPDLYERFRSLQTQWKAIGDVPRDKYNELKQSYHHYVDRFHNLLNLNKDLKRLDFKRSLEQKLELIQQAEALNELQDIPLAHKKLQRLHEIWKKNTNPVEHRISDEIWDKFSAATKIIRDKWKNYLLANAKLRQQVINNLEKMDYSQNTTQSQWSKTMQSFKKQREEYFKIGRVSKKQNEYLWQQLKEITKRINKARNDFYKILHKEQNENLKYKKQLIEKVNAIKDSTDFHRVTPMIKQYQEQWKTIGHVPYKYIDALYKDFRAACDAYFEKLRKIQNKSTTELLENLAKKKTLLEKFTKKVNEDSFTLEQIKEVLKTWKDLGAIPKESQQIQMDFRNLVDRAFKQLSIEHFEASFIIFKIVVDDYVLNNETQKIQKEFGFINKKIDELVRDIGQLETNLSFVANASDDNPLVENVKKQIAQKQQDLKIYKRKLQYLRSL